MECVALGFEERGQHRHVAQGDDVRNHGQLPGDRGNAHRVLEVSFAQESNHLALDLDVFRIFQQFGALFDVRDARRCHDFADSRQPLGDRDLVRSAGNIGDAGGQRAPAQRADLARCLQLVDAFLGLVQAKDAFLNRDVLDGVRRLLQLALADRDPLALACHV